MNGRPAWARRREPGAADGRAVAALAAAMGDGDAVGIRSLLHPRAGLVIDSGLAGPDAAEGRTDAAEALAALAGDGVVVVPASVNGRPGVLLRRDDVVVTVVAAEVHAGLIDAVWIVCNPDKLRHWNLRAER